jgi:hypothetical protein
VVLANGRYKCGACDFGGPTERVNLVGVSISFKKNFLSAPIHSPLSGHLIGPSIWPCQPRWGSWAFKTQLLPRLDHEVRSPIFNAKRPDGQTDEEIVVEVEKKVVQMIGNYTHKEWECARTS